MGTKLSVEEVRYRLQTFFADPAAIGDNAIAAAPGVGVKWVVYGYQVWNNADTAQTARFRSAANSKGPAMVMGVSTGAKTEYDMPVSGFPIFECNDNEALNLNLSAATAVGVMVFVAKERV